jgi:hypothetical protein
MLPFQPTRATAAISQIPQPAGWGSFTRAYTKLLGPFTTVGCVPALEAGVKYPQPSGWGIARRRSPVSCRPN